MRKTAARIADTLRAIARECRGATRISAGIPSTVRIVADIFLYRALRLGALPGENRHRSIQLKTGETVTYRLNRGDIQGIREVLIDEAYRLPFDISPHVIVDLGANIGLTSLYLNRRYHPHSLIAVEPEPSNAAIARTNLSPIGVTVLEAAVASQDGVGTFHGSRDSNLGALSDGDAGQRVRLISMANILESLPEGRIDLLKLDIEGGEQALLTEGTAWLACVNAIIAEFHPERVDYPGLIQRLVNQGFRYIPAGTAWPGSMDSFIRDPAHTI